MAKPTQCCKATILQLKINKFLKKETDPDIENKIMVIKVDNERGRDKLGIWE